MIKIENNTDDFQTFSFKRNKLAYLLTYMSIAYVNPTIQQYEVASVGFFIFSFVLFLLYKRRPDRLLMFVAGSLLTLLVLQAFVHQNFSVRSFVGIYLIWLFPYFIFRIVGGKYLPIFINVLYILSIIGLIFWALSNLSPAIHSGLFQMVEFLGTDPVSGESFLIYNLENHRPTDIFFMKNAGPFNEGGNYSCYLIFALVINTVYQKKLLESKNIIFIISILTTTSTAGYIALFIYLFVYYYSARKISYKILLLPASIFLAIYLYNHTPFLKEKIEMQLETQMEMDMNANVRVGRFHSARVSLEIFKENPIIGKGLYRKDRFISKEEEEIGVTGTSNGVVDMAVKYGIIGWFLYFFFFYKGLLLMSKTFQGNKWFGHFAILPILAIGLAQIPFTHPAYLVFLYLGYRLFVLWGNTKPTDTANGRHEIVNAFYNQK